MTLSFHPEARAEYREAALWYSRQKPRLGSEFVSAVEAALAAIVENPERYAPVDHGVRRYPMKRFPYRIHFLHLEDRNQVVIYAVMHVRREPDYWKHRLPDEPRS